ncbi:NAD(P)H-binding protein [Streptomyces sp. NPDC058466]|uniref:NAD(P)H-binding protein n=1 Tax=Streptomyces sp. NPDC058466 TaxID=3346512 RepID=UPI0036557FF9
MILLTGATGTVGRLVAERLSPTEPVRLLTRNPVRAAPPAGRQVEVVGGDFGDFGSLVRVLAGVRSALLVTADPLTHAHDEHFVRAARTAGVRHVVKLSALAVTDPAATDLITRWQRGNEDLLRTSGMAWTLLRPRAFMSNTLGWARSIREEGVVRALDGTSANAVVDPRDIADVAALALTDPERHGGRAYPLTGPAPIAAAEQTAVLAEVLQRPLSFCELTESQVRERLGARYPGRVVDALMESAARQRSGAKSRVDPTVRELLGRQSGDYRAWATDHAGLFAT